MFQTLFVRLYRWSFYRTQSRKLLEDIETFYQCKTILLYLYSKEIEMTNSCENETHLLLGDLTKFVNGGQMIVLYGINETFCKRMKRLFKLCNASYHTIFNYILRKNETAYKCNKYLFGDFENRRKNATCRRNVKENANCLEIIILGYFQIIQKCPLSWN